MNAERKSAQALSCLLRERKLTLAAAESCTGGLFSKCMTDLSGASEIYHGGVVSYVNGVKANVLGVSVETLDRFGAVSAETAAEMAAGVRRVCGSDIGISFTGVAGPNRDDRGNEVGTVYVGVATSEKNYVNLLELAGDRDTIRRLAVEQGMEQLLTLLQEKGE
ncbi:MAG: nicotinamide-nucleotide amidohydrolase family protein [Oscillospiraceae bacterium]|nr:nicotinamide-nucleotide amidohydrolase family protein [Oscillospiraceae bacterium]